MFFEKRLILFSNQLKTHIKMSTLVGKKAPSFKASAVVNGGEIINDFSLDQYLGKNHILFLYKVSLIDYLFFQSIYSNTFSFNL